MKKFFFLAMLPLVCALTVFSSCSESDSASDNTVLTEFEYPESFLFGTWDLAELDGESVSGSSYSTSFTFSPDGETCRSQGPLGFDGKGVYSASGKTVKLYYYGSLFYTFKFKSLTNDYASVEAVMLDDAGTYMFKLKKN